MKADNLAHLARCKALAIAAMIEAGGKPCWVAATRGATAVETAAAAAPPSTALERAWIKSIGRVPGCPPPPGYVAPPPPRPLATPQGGYSGPSTRVYTRKTAPCPLRAARR